MKLTRKRLIKLIQESYSRDDMIKTYVKSKYNIRDIFDSLWHTHGTGDFFDAAHDASMHVAEEIQSSNIFPYVNPQQLINIIKKILLVELFSLHRQWLNKQEH